VCPPAKIIDKVTPQHTALGRALAPVARPFDRRSYEKAAGVGFKPLRSVVEKKNATPTPQVPKPTGTATFGGATYAYDPSTRSYPGLYIG
jgi:ABC-type sulfate transport system substrate-binding protein